MRKMLDGNIRSQVIAGLIIAAILTLVGWVLGAWPVIYGWIVVFFDFLMSNVTLPWWALLLFILGTLAFFMGIIRRIFSQSPSPYTMYQQDVFDGFVWRWRFLEGEMMTPPVPYCPKDDTLLVFRYKWRSLGERIESFCETCNTFYPGPEGIKVEQYQDRIIRQIGRKVRSGEWLQAVQAATAKKK